MGVGLLMSGGLDSAALAFWKKPDVAMTIDYGQVCAEAEVLAAQQICREIGLVQELVRVDCRHLGSGDLAGISPHDDAPTQEWWPYRNQLLVTIGAMRALAMGVDRLLLGTVASDSSHRDGTVEFIASIDKLLQLQEGGMRVLAPAIEMSSAELIRTSGVSVDVLAWCHSCHTANTACGRCRGCFKHQSVFSELGYVPY